MKKSISLFLLFATICTYGQSNLKFNIITSIDHSVASTGQSEEFYQIEKSNKKLFGYTLDLGLELLSGQHSSLVIGAKYSKKRYNPDLETVFYYGGRLSFEEDTIWVNAPHLTLLEFETFSLPIYHKRYFNRNAKISFFTLAGVAVDFAMSRKETYTDYASNAEGSFPFEALSASKRNFKLYGTTIDVGGGINWKLNNSIALVLQANCHLFEYRKPADKLINVWPDVYNGEDVHWKNTFLPLGQISCGLGFQVLI